MIYAFFADEDELETFAKGWASKLAPDAVSPATAAAKLEVENTKAEAAATEAVETAKQTANVKGAQLDALRAAESTKKKVDKLRDLNKP